MNEDRNVRVEIPCVCERGAVMEIWEEDPIYVGQVSCSFCGIKIEKVGNTKEEVSGMLLAGMLRKEIT